MSPASKIKINHDKDNDILYVIVDGADTRTKNIDVANNVVVRLKYPSNEVVGFIIHDFSVTCKGWKDLKDWDLMEKFDTLIEGMNNLHIIAA